MTTTPSLKKISTADLQAALAKTIAELTGWAAVHVNVEQITYTPNGPGESARITLQTTMRTDNDEQLPF